MIEELEKQVEQLEAALEGLKKPESHCGREMAVEITRLRGLRSDLQEELRKTRLKLMHARKRRDVKACFAVHSPS